MNAPERHWHSATLLPADGAVLQVKNLACGRHGKRVLEDVHFSVQAGESVALLGPNGAGKSSLLKVLAGEWQASAGEYLLHGRPVRHWLPRQLARVRAVMPQQHGLNFPLAVADVVALGLPGARRGNRRDPVVMQMLERLELAHLLARPFPSLSGGEQQRVQLARVLAQIQDAPAPPLLLLDECTSALDPCHQHRVLQCLHDLRRDGCALLWAVHDLNLAARYADRILLLQDGEVVANDTPEAVLTPAMLAQVFDIQVKILRDADGLFVLQQRART